MKKGIDKVKSRVNKPSRGKDSKFFSGTKRGEIPELRGELHSGDRGVLKDAVKKVIANITVGKDMSPLFPDVISCMQTEDLELKKLVYLYLINYAKSNPDMTLLAVNTFVKDASHASPIIRALSVRTMGCIRVEKITEYLTKPLQAALNDEDPYVRKTGAVAVAKLYDISPAMVKEMGFISKLRDLICDGNPAVVANSVAALSEIQDTTTGNVFEITSAVLQKLLAAISECTEWGQVFILDALAKYDPVDSREAEQMIDRVLPRLAHQNAAVVLSAVKIVMKFMEHVQDPAAVDNFSRKLAPPLVTLAQSQMPEIQYVALRNILLIVQRRPQLLTQKIRVFFCKYHEPIYVKMEKLEILVRLASEKNIQQVLAELKEYATEVDVDFVRKSVRTIGRCAIKLERAAEGCIQVLLDLISSKVNYVVQEAVVVIKDIFRRYPNKYEAVISVLCDSLESLDEPEAKASMIWIIGEYANRIENADELLQSFLDGFHDETTVVQLQLLTAAVKLYLKRPDEAEEKLVS
ncbi:BETAC-AD [Symbiodinium sp. KB8]|nr:BETAC-AD [Symbiodinium sp. KB8]